MPLITANFKSLGKDTLTPITFSGQEPISGLFSYQLELRSTNSKISAKDVVGKEVGIAIEQADADPRYFHGFVNRFRITGRSGDWVHYQAEMVPWLWFLTRSADCRIFPEQKTAVEIIEQVFDEHGFTDFNNSNVSDKHPKLEYCVQYRETAFNFVSRLMEQEGIFYFFLHDEDKHTLVMADKKDTYVPLSLNELTYQHVEGGAVYPDRITAWEHEYEFRPVGWSQTDYNFETPGNNLFTSASSSVKLAGPKKNQYEIFDYPGEYPDTKIGQEYTDVRMQEDDTPHSIASGASHCKVLSPGHWFKLKHNEMPDEAGEYVITSVNHWAQNPSDAGEPDRIGSEYRNSFSCIPKSVLYRPPRITPKPIVQGPQTAVVVSDPDQYGRVKVRFHWVRTNIHPDGSEHDSCWVRVSQNWAGKEWGGMFVPHMEHEVVVEFLEGDPDRPIITGRVYNADQVVPLKLPANKTKCIIRDHGDNQMIWEGKDGEQFVRVDQACGNELIMNGKPGEEGIQLRDKFGNVLYLDAAAKSISLYSPNHASGIVLGKSSHVFSESNSMKHTGGTTLGLHTGQKTSIDVGTKLGFTLGVSTDVFVGGKVSVSAGRTVEYAKGTKVTFASASSFSKASENSALEAEKDVVLDANNNVFLLGGAQDKSQLQANNEKLVLSYKSGNKGRKSVEPPSFRALAGTALATSTHIITTGAAAIGDIRGTSPTAQTKASIDSTDRFAAKVESWAGSVIGVAGAGLMVLEGMVEGAKKETQEKARKEGIADHAGPEGRITLSKAGVYIDSNDDKCSIFLAKDGDLLSLKSMGETKLDAKDNIHIESVNHIFMRCKGFQGKKGFLKFKNLEMTE